MCLGGGVRATMLLEESDRWPKHRKYALSDNSFIKKLRRNVGAQTEKGHGKPLQDEDTVGEVETVEELAVALFLHGWVLQLISWNTFFFYFKPTPEHLSWCQCCLILGLVNDQECCCWSNEKEERIYLQHCDLCVRALSSKQNTTRHEKCWKLLIWLKPAVQDLQSCGGGGRGEDWLFAVCECVKRGWEGWRT